MLRAVLAIVGLVGLLCSSILVAYPRAPALLREHLKGHGDYRLAGRWQLVGRFVAVASLSALWTALNGV